MPVIRFFPPNICVFMSMLQLTPYKFQIWEPLDYANAKYSNVMFVYWLDEIHRIEIFSNVFSSLNFSSCIFIDWCFFVFPSMQCSVHKLCGYGVSDRASGHCQGNLRNNDNQPGTHSHHRSFQGVGTRHHAYWQPEKVSRSLLFMLLVLFVQFDLKYFPQQAFLQTSLSHQHSYVLWYWPPGEKVSNCFVCYYFWSDFWSDSIK